MKKIPDARSPTVKNKMVRAGKNDGGTGPSTAYMVTHNGSKKANNDI